MDALAAQFAGGLDQASGKIFLWRLEEPPLTFREIARALALPEHKVYATHRQTVRAMQSFVANWPGPPLADLDGGVGLYFIEAVRKICEKNVR